jgi:hypothetical protein
MRARYGSPTTPIGVTGLERGPAKLVVEVTESGKDTLRWRYRWW